MIEGLEEAVDLTTLPNKDVLRSLKGMGKDGFYQDHTFCGETFESFSPDFSLFGNIFVLINKIAEFSVSKT